MILDLVQIACHHLTHVLSFIPVQSKWWVYLSNGSDILPLEKSHPFWHQKVDEFHLYSKLRMKVDKVWMRRRTKVTIRKLLNMLHSTFHLCHNACKLSQLTFLMLNLIIIFKTISSNIFHKNLYVSIIFQITKHCIHNMSFKLLRHYT